MTTTPDHIRAHALGVLATADPLPAQPPAERYRLDAEQNRLAVANLRNTLATERGAAAAEQERLTGIIAELKRVPVPTFKARGWGWFPWALLAAVVWTWCMQKGCS